MNLISTYHKPVQEVHIVPDIETLSTKVNAKILSIGAVAVLNGEIIGQFYVNIDVASYNDYLKEDFSEDEGTIKWWNEPERELAKQALNDDQHHIKDALEKFSIWVNDVQGLYVWGYGAEFDNSILKNAFDVTDVTWPFKFYNHRCLRTLVNSLDIRVSRNDGTHHNALHDAVNQGKALIECIKVLEVFNNLHLRRLLINNA